MQKSAVAYRGDLALAENGAALSASSQEAYPALSPANGRRPVNYGLDWDAEPFPVGCWVWRDPMGRRYPHWLEIAWERPRTFNEVVVSLPVLGLLSEPRRTIGRLALRYWDDPAGRWRLLEAGNGEANPVEGWIAPRSADGSETRVFRCQDVTTEKLRLAFEEGNSEGWSFLDRIGVYKRTEARPPLSLRAISTPAADAVIEPGDEGSIVAGVVDADGNAVMGEPVTFSAIAGGGAVTGPDADGGSTVVYTDRSGQAAAVVRTGPDVGSSTYAAGSGATEPGTVRFAVTSLTRQAALATGLAWLQGAAAELQRGSRRTAFDGTVMYTPDGVASYTGIYARDFQYMIEGYAEGVPPSHIRRAFEYLVERQRGDGAMPNKVIDDGSPVYHPGPTFQQDCFGPIPPTDNPQFVVKIAYRYWRLTGDLTLFDQYKDQLERGMRFLLRSPDTSLVYIPPETPSSPYGFTDSIAKTGDQLFDSVLYHEAALNLAELFRENGDTEGATRWETEAGQVKDDLQTLRDPESGMFLAASVDCRQIDIWGSAFAASTGAIPEDQRIAVGRYLKENYTALVCRGQVRHTAPGEYWEKTVIPYYRDMFENGPYWAIPVTWVAGTIAAVDRDLARQMVVDLVKDFQRHGINECILPDTGYLAIPKYVASATNPIPGLEALVRG